MKRETNIIVTIYYIIIFLIIFSPLIELFSEYLSENATWNPWDYARITDVDYQAILVDEPNSKGKVVITEKLTFDIHAASKNNLFWELWRDLSEDYVDGVKVDYKVNSVKQILPDGSEVIYDQSSKLYWEDSDYTTRGTQYGCGPGKWFHSKGPYNESYRRYECVFFYVNGLYREKPVFEIEYEMNNAALRYNDCSELYLCMYSEDTVNYLNSFRGEILIPNKDMPSEGNYYAHTYGTNSNEFEFAESTKKNPGYHTFYFDLDKSDLKFKPYNEYIEFSLVSYGEDKHKFTQYASTNQYSGDDVLAELQEDQIAYETEPYNYMLIKIVVLLICLLFSFLVLKKLLNADDKIEKKYNFYKPTMQMDYFRDIPSNLDPTFAASLAFCKNKPISSKDSDIYAAIMLSLVRKGYIELERINNQKDWDNSNVKIIIKHKPDIQLHPELKLVEQSLESFYALESDLREKLEPLTLTEEAYFNLISRHAQNSEITMSAFQDKIYADYENTDTFVKTVEKATVNIGISGGYFQKADYTQPKKELSSKSFTYGLIGFLLLTAVNLISYQTRLDLACGGFSVLGISFIFGSFIYYYLSKQYALLTQFGEDEFVKWRGLYNFLNSETLMNERTVIELPLWEQYLVYATAFGISDKVVQALQIRCPEIDTSQMLNNSYFRSNHFHHNSRSFRRTVRSASRTARSSAYGGGYGGYGGGGRGGGGGRRRSLISYNINNFFFQTKYILIN